MMSPSIQKIELWQLSEIYNLGEIFVLEPNYNNSNDILDIRKYLEFNTNIIDKNNIYLDYTDSYNKFQNKILVKTGTLINQQQDLYKEIYLIFYNYVKFYCISPSKLYDKLYIGRNDY